MKTLPSKRDGVVLVYKLGYQEKKKKPKLLLLKEMILNNQSKCICITTCASSRFLHGRNGWPFYSFQAPWSMNPHL